MRCWTADWYRTRRQLQGSSVSAQRHQHTGLSDIHPGSGLQNGLERLAGARSGVALVQPARAALCFQPSRPERSWRNGLRLEHRRRRTRDAEAKTHGRGPNGLRETTLVPGFAASRTCTGRCGRVSSAITTSSLRVLPMGWRSHYDKTWSGQLLFAAARRTGAVRIAR